MNIFTATTQRRSTKQTGFALPTVLIASIVMLMVLLAAIQSTVSVSVAIRGQYTDKLSAEAAESGVAMANACLASAAPVTPTTFSNTGTGRSGTTQTFTAPTVGNYVIDAYGAQGGSAYLLSTTTVNPGGKGAQARGTFALTAGQVVTIMVGQQGINFAGATRGAGGGGGTFVVSGGTLLLAAGGGGGGGQYVLTSAADGQAGTSGGAGTVANNGIGGTSGAGGTAGTYSAGGAGWTSNGAAGSNTTGGATYNNGGLGGVGYGGTPTMDGGFGGGGGAYAGSGGGGGYSGGGGGGWSYSGNGGGGGSYAATSGTSQLFTAGSRTGQGTVTIQNAASSGASWSTASPLRPNTDCSGVVVAGRSAYLLNQNGVRSKFVVGSYDGSGNISSTGITELTRKTNGDIVKQYKRSIIQPAAASGGSAVVAAPILTDNFFALSPGGSTAVRMVVGGDKRIWMWGNGQTSPTVVQSGSDWATGSAGDHNRCAIKTTGSLWCWTGTAAATQLGSATDWLQVSAGNQNSCGIKTGGTLWCWGANQYGEIGDGTTTASAAPKLVGSATDWKEVQSGFFGTCAIKTTGARWCWSFNGYANPGYSGLGNSSTTTVTTPTLMSGGVNWSSISYAAISGCGVTTTGALYCWGQAINPNDSLQDGRLGIGVVSGVQVPTRVGTASDWRSVNMGSGSFGQIGHTCATKTDNTLWCWGKGGRVGDGTSTTAFAPVQIPGAWMQVESTGASTCGVKSDKSVWCWGEGAGGQLGDGSTTNRLAPVSITIN